MDYYILIPIVINNKIPCGKTNLFLELHLPLENVLRNKLLLHNTPTSYLILHIRNISVILSFLERWKYFGFYEIPSIWYFFPKAVNSVFLEKLDVFGILFPTKVNCHNVLFLYWLCLSLVF